MGVKDAAEDMAEGVSALVRNQGGRYGWDVDAGIVVEAAALSSSSSMVTIDAHDMRLSVVEVAVTLRAEGSKGSRPA